MENLSAKATGEGTWSTTESPLTPEEEDTIITLVVVIVGVIAAIILLFSMGIFIDCKTQKSSIVNGDGAVVPGKRRRLRLRMPPIGRAKHQHHQRLGRREDSKCLASDMCPPGSSDGAAVAARDVATTSLEAVV